MILKHFTLGSLDYQWKATVMVFGFHFHMVVIGWATKLWVGTAEFIPLFSWDPYKHLVLVLFPLNAIADLDFQTPLR